MKTPVEFVVKNPIEATKKIDRSQVHVWITIMLDYQMRGQIGEDEKGRKFIEADLSLPKWSHASACAHSLAKVIESAFELDGETLQIRMRFMQKDGNDVQPQIILTASAAPYPDPQKLKALVAAFSAAVTPQGDLMTEPQHIQLDGDELTKVQDAASIFLQSHQGQQVQRPMQMVIDNQAVSTISGRWREGLREELKPNVEHKFQALYDGRRLRSRTLYVVQAGTRSRGFEIFYDEDKFDHAIRELQDDKHAMLDLVVNESWQDSKKSRFDLKSLSRIAAPQELELQHSGPAVARG
jgi:hypothetical protein